MSYLQEKGRRGYSTYTFNGKYLYSRYNPLREAANYLEQLGPLKERAITFCGADFINHELVKSSVKSIISFEPIPFENLTDSPKVIRFSHIDDLKSYVMEQGISIADISLIYWQPFIETEPELFLEYLRRVRVALEKSTYSAGTAEEFSGRELKNILLNLKGLREISCLTCGGARQTNPALIVSSGYSLAANLDYLKLVRTHCTLFALPSALPFLLARGVRPDYVIAVDPGYATYFHLAKALPALEAGDRLELITTLSISPSILKLERGFRFHFFSYAGPLEGALFQGVDVVSSCSEGSVFFNTLRLLKSCRFSRVIMVGQDFGFKDGRSHINEGFFEREFLARSSYFNSLEGDLKAAECAKPFAEIRDGEQRIRSEVSLRIYYEHLLESSFGLELMLSEAPFNRMGGRFGQAERGYLLESFPPLKGGGLNFTSHRLEEVKGKLSGTLGREVRERYLANDKSFCLKYFGK